jgi:two-component system, sensor histidine kinase and response regulator
MKIDSTTRGEVLDVDGTLARFGGDHELFRDIIGFFLEDSPPLWSELKEAVAAQNASDVRSAAHALKGLAAGCGGMRAAQAAQRIESAGAEGDLENVDVLMSDLEVELKQLRQSATRYQS